MKALLITKCQDDLLWYRSYVGKVVPLVSDTVQYSEFTSQEPAGYINFVRCMDAEVVDIPDYNRRAPYGPEGLYYKPTFAERTATALHKFQQATGYDTAEEFIEQKKMCRCGNPDLMCDNCNCWKQTRAMCG